MAYVPIEDTTTGTMLDVVIRGSAVPAEVVPLPFYRRSGR
jgi:glycine cleavage system aminomethyltransferase T